MLILLLLASFTAQSLALPSTLTHYTKRDGPGGHSKDEPGMAGMDHSGMSGGGMSGGGMAGGLADILLQSPYTQKLLNMVVGVFPVMKTAKSDLNMPSTFKRQGAKKANIRFGPFDIVDAKTRAKTKNPSLLAMDPGGTSFMNKITDFPKDISLLDAVVKLVYEDGSPAAVANGIYNHHVAFLNTAKLPPAMAACPGQAAKLGVPVSVFVATGEDGNSYNYTPDLPGFNSGYYIGPNDGIAVLAEIVNYTNETKKVYASVDYNYVSGKPKYDVSSVTLSVTQCNSNANVGIKPEKGQMVFGMASKNMTVQMDGYIFAVRGHLHDGGDYVGLEVNGKPVCKSKAIYGGKEGTSAAGDWQTVSDMSTCKDPVPVKKGDLLVVNAKYDLKSHPARSHSGGGEAEEMGLAMFTFATTTDSGKSAPATPSAPALSAPNSSASSAGDGGLGSLLSSAIGGIFGASRPV
ncbi:hypothetical protein BT63DRAFT_439670 [Microthyrium microscopicum]|uniref:Uncharacterized protein n=1 Tax=Microthyrium microscopicum TaxID=703497 RepID=A0A6A6UGK2_9PEZI|nr:hypothetical protein BT63DRAFT_439670 [Microthyrium microscopicum]